ncbi:MAG TPA: hydrogenase maturation nickel metallochaperone HypA [Spirochaetota bacterium]|nr:hydrogenase maturation nickel metallochaperone HypA [Spirochaetota bacterium]HQO01121.1 hydrogenase maturation nickel metallochaperone HypA [Spirochaetota bacterium]HQP48733.1 hydrogenase maturation nickel metallochaperone HypA [Spirochaetota bacterium]
MHELSIMTSILDIVIRHAETHRAVSVKRIDLQVGELSDLIPDWMQRYFDFVSKDTIAENAQLAIEKIPAVLRCRACSHEFTLDRESWQFTCTACGSSDVEIVSGREFTVKSIEIE